MHNALKFILDLPNLRCFLRQRFAWFILLSRRGSRRSSSRARTGWRRDNRDGRKRQLIVCGFVNVRLIETASSCIGVLDVNGHDTLGVSRLLLLSSTLRFLLLRLFVK